MHLEFHKYEGTGNDFILIDNRRVSLNNNASLVARLCDRNFGIGADGLILLNSSGQADFEMVYFNADGNEAQMCGNGGRCIIAFAHMLGIIRDKCRFDASDGLHEGTIKKRSGRAFMVGLSMQDIKGISAEDDHFIINTGVPHFVKFVEDLNQFNVLEEGRKIRYDNLFKPEGINVNFCKVVNGQLIVRTYERGVENETLSCGTGVTAASVAAFLKYGHHPPIQVKTLGGQLNVDFVLSGDIFKSVRLSGPVNKVYQGEILV